MGVLKIPLKLIVLLPSAPDTDRQTKDFACIGSTMLLYPRLLTWHEQTTK